ncbi:hypothetical protein K2O51_34445 (plasmid) [Cupriavidus pinatubonensis]|uniref:hypothetical protein n=1 Tax=Cupriavidus pinatubonensis TaxID=248026 RepID=UPI001C737A6B|nr:hypothetical protein [Cupriavidus pinatubonensis]QYY33917.1 hypothetical protein K2O51_34445 [Cupriavidus pinatubonensis]
MTITAVICTEISTIKGTSRDHLDKGSRRVTLAASIVVVAAIAVRHMYLHVVPEDEAGMDAVRDTAMPLTICAPGIQSDSRRRDATELDSSFRRHVCLES